jgi:hypothetical protein
MQIDWSPYLIPVGSRIQKVHALGCLLCHSRKLFVHCFADERQPTLLASTCGRWCAWPSATGARPSWPPPSMRTVQELMGHKTISMTLRYSHLSPAHQLDAVQRLNRKPTGTATDTKKPAEKTAVAAGEQVPVVKEERNAPWVIRTPDLLIRSQALYPTELRARA